MTAYHFFIDFALASILILIGQLLRSKLTIFQRFFMPSSMIAGFLGLILGPSILSVLPFSDAMGTYAGILIILIFTIVGLNGFEFEQESSGKEEAKRILGFQMYRILALFAQFIIPIIATILIFTKIFPEINQGFGMLMASGFYGGHGTAAAVGSTFTNLGWADANDLAITFATIGILTGVFGGLILIKLATKKGQTGYIEDFQYISGDLKTGLIEKSNRESMGEETISPISLDTLCFHLSLVLALAGIGYLINLWLAANVLSGIPDFTIAYIVSLIFFLIFKRTKLYDYVDTNINDKISGTATDYLVFFGIGSISIEVIAKYALPLIFMSLIGIVIVILTVYPFGKGFNKDSWFERSIFIYGYSTGVFAIGFVLLRIVDPDSKSKTVEDTAITPLTNFIEIVLWSLLPALLLNSNGWPVVGVLTAISIVCIIITRISGAWWFKVPDSERIVLGTDIPKKGSI